MKRFVNTLSLIVLSLIALGQKTDVLIDNIKNNSGLIRVAIYQNQNQFSNENAYKLLTFSKSDMKNGQLKVKLDLPSGTYGISVLDDVNKNAEMDYGMFGIPKEGFAFSNYYHSGMTLPKFSSFSFKTLPSSKIYCKMKYY